MGARPISPAGALRLPSTPVLRRRLLLAAVLAAVLASAYLLWFRDSSFVRVTDVQVNGAAADGGVEGALVAAGTGLSTLHLDHGALREAVADDPDVASLSATADFPHALRIEVELRRPAGYVAAGGGTVLAADGVVLATGAERPAGLPVLDVDDAVGGDRATGPALTLAEILGAAPGALASRAQGGRIDAEEVPIVTLSGGLELRFGDPTQAAAKWRAAAAVIADPGFEGAAYLDLSVPSRPVAGSG